MGPIERDPTVHDCCSDAAFDFEPGSLPTQITVLMMSLATLETTMFSECHLSQVNQPTVAMPCARRDRGPDVQHRSGESADSVTN